MLHIIWAVLQVGDLIQVLPNLQMRTPYWTPKQGTTCWYDRARVTQNGDILLDLLKQIETEGRNAEQEAMEIIGLWIHLSIIGESQLDINVWF